MAKHKQNSNYITKKSVEKERALAEAKRKKRTAITVSIIVASVILTVALIFGAFAYIEKHGVKTDMTVTHTAKIEVLGYGEIELELYGKEAPKTVENFVKLANEGFYDGLTFHRIIPDFMIQGGDPLGNGYGDSGTDIFGEFEANGFKNAIKHERGTISMARGDDPNSASCQFFIVHKTGKSISDSLDGLYASFGKVTKGMDVVDVICSSAEPGQNGAIEETDQPIILSVTVKEVTE